MKVSVLLLCVLVVVGVEGNPLTPLLKLLGEIVKKWNPPPTTDQHLMKSFGYVERETMRNLNQLKTFLSKLRDSLENQVFSLALFFDDAVNNNANLEDVGSFVALPFNFHYRTIYEIFNTTYVTVLLRFMTRNLTHIGFKATPKTIFRIPMSPQNYVFRKTASFQSFSQDRFVSKLHCDMYEIFPTSVYDVFQKATSCWIQPSEGQVKFNSSNVGEKSDQLYVADLVEQIIKDIENTPLSHYVSEVESQKGNITQLEKFTVQQYVESNVNSKISTKQETFLKLPSNTWIRMTCLADNLTQFQLNEDTLWSYACHKRHIVKIKVPTVVLFKEKKYNFVKESESEMWSVLPYVEVHIDDHCTVYFEKEVWDPRRNVCEKCMSLI